MNKHFVWSMIKSGFRIVGFAILIPFPWFGIGFLIVAETFGIIEEF